MPSIQTLVADLHNKNIAMGAPMEMGGANNTPLSLGHAIKYKFKLMKVTLSGTIPPRLKFATRTGTDSNGTYLGYDEKLATVTKIDILHPIVVSGNFSGCAYKVFQSSDFVYCVHISRIGGKFSERNVTLMDDYAKQKGWIEIQNIPTSGVKAEFGAESIAIVSQLVGGRIDTVRLALAHQTGYTINSTRYTNTL